MPLGVPIPRRSRVASCDSNRIDPLDQAERGIQTLADVSDRALPLQPEKTFSFQYSLRSSDSTIVQTLSDDLKGPASETKRPSLQGKLWKSSLRNIFWCKGRGNWPVNFMGFEVGRKHPIRFSSSTQCSCCRRSSSYRWWSTIRLFQGRLCQIQVRIM